MATKEDSTAKAAPAKATPVKAAEPAATPKETPTKVPAAQKDDGPRVSTCVVNDGRGMHVGNAVNGDVCSYHAMHYDRHGNPR